MREYRVISADSHLETPPDKWVERLPVAMREYGPRVVDLPDGGQGWLIGEGEPVPLGLATTGGLSYPEFRTRGLRYDSGLPGTGDPRQRLAEQDRDGTDAEVLFSTVITSMLSRMPGPEVIEASVRAYNSWLSDYCSVAPDRLFGIALLPFTGTRAATDELRRIASLPGLRGAHLLRFPSGGHVLTSDDEEFWATAEETGLPLIAHHNFGGEDQRRATPLPGIQERAIAVSGSSDWAHFAWLLTCDLPLPTLPILTIIQLMLGGVFDRHPRLRFHFAETGIGWLPYWLEQMEDRFDRHRFWARAELARRPIEYIREHFTFSFQEDHAGVDHRHLIGVDTLCWAADFPHSVGDWPWSRETRARQFGGLPAGERLKIEALNIAAQLGVITRDEKERRAAAAQPVADPSPLPDRGRRRVEGQRGESDRTLTHA
jgi:predicted TIM-barrel fold metal-dependent hydrolase